MNKRILGIVALLALAIAVVWTLRARTRATSLVEPVHVESAPKSGEPAPLTPSEAAHPARESVEASALAEASAPKDTVTAFALIKVLVVNKASRAPMSDIDVHATYDDGKRG